MIPGHTAEGGQVAPQSGCNLFSFSLIRPHAKARKMLKNNPPMDAD